MSLLFCLLLPAFLGPTHAFGAIVPATPWLSPASGTYAYSSGLTVTIATTSAGSAIHYTTDGTTPNVKSKLYTGPIIIPSTPTKETIKAVAILNGVSSWSAASATYTVAPPLPLPLVSPAAGTFGTAQQVKITSPMTGGVIHYTTDGSAVSASSPVYSGPLTISKTQTIIALVAGIPGYTMSGPLKATYVISASTPVISPASGTFSHPPSIVITTALQSAKIYYTTDGTTPTSLSSLYNGPFALSSTASGTTTIRALAIAAGYPPSTITSSTIQLALPTGVIATATVNATPSGSISPTFLGLSHGWSDAQIMMGSNSRGVDPIYSNLLNQLSESWNAPIVIRIVGDSINTGQLAISDTEPFTELTQNVPVKFIMGINLGANDLLMASDQAAAFQTNIPSTNLMAFEIGNEPDGYSAKGLRPADYSFSDFLAQYDQWHSTIENVTGNAVNIAGPTLGSGEWDLDAGAAIANGSLEANIVTQHEYLACYNPAAPAPADYLLQPASAQMHFFSVGPYLTSAHAAHLPFRIAEMNSMCLGGQPGLSDSFSSALWAIDAMFEYANLGVDGVNWNSSYLGGAYDLFQIHLWKKSNGLNGYTLGTVRPLYYGLMFFSRAAGTSSQLLPVATITDSNLKIWATVDAKGKGHLIIINKEQTATGKVEVNLNGFSRGTVTRLSAASGYLATNGVTFGGQTFDNSTDGTLQGTLETETVLPVSNLWTVSVQPMSAVLVDLEP